MENEKNRIEISLSFGKNKIIQVLEKLQNGAHNEQFKRRLQKCIEQIELMFEPGDNPIFEPESDLNFEPENNSISEPESNFIFINRYFMYSNSLVSNESDNSSELFSLSFFLESNNKEETPSHLIVDDSPKSINNTIVDCQRNDENNEDIFFNNSQIYDENNENYFISQSYYEFTQNLDANNEDNFINNFLIYDDSIYQSYNNGNNDDLEFSSQSSDENSESS